jgi:hypothetical protein
VRELRDSPDDEPVAVPVLGRAAVALYPAWWRQRYGEDQSAFLSDLKGEGRSVLRVLPNLVAGAARARLSGTGAPPTPAVWWSRTRAGVTLSTLPVMLLLPLMVLAGSRGVFSNGAGHIGVAARVAQHAGQAIFLASLLTLLVLTWGWRILVSEAEHVPRGTARLRYEAAMASPVAALGTALGLSAIASRVRAGGVLLSSSWAWSPTTHRYYGVSAVWTRGHPLLVASLHDAAWVFAIGGWVVAAALVGRAARRAPSTYRLVRSGVRVARATAVCAGALAVTFTVYELAIILQRWHLVHAANAACSPIPPPPVLRTALGCNALSAPAGHVVLTSPLSASAGLWIALVALCAVFSVLGTPLAGRSMRAAEALEAT